MRRIALIAALLCCAFVSDGVPRARDGRGRFGRGGIALASSGISRALFEFAPADGAGMGAACACVTPTGSKGETMTFTRASSATCLKSNTTSGIANGDMVTCATDQARVMPGGDGTGPLGIDLEPAATNLCLWSEDFTNAAWSKETSGVAAAVVTADQATAPDGATTADRIQFAATTGTNTSALGQLNMGTPGNGACSVFLKGNGSSGTIDLIKYNGGAGTTDTVLCSFNTSTWTRCETAAVNGAASTSSCYMGNLGEFVSTPHSAVDVFVWGGQFETGVTGASSYIKTTTAAATRASEVFRNDNYVPVSSTNGCIAATVICETSNCGSFGEHAIISAQVDLDHYDRLVLDNTNDFLHFYSQSGAIAASATFTPRTPMRAYGNWTGAAGVLGWNGAPSPGTFAAPGIQTVLVIGNYNRGSGVVNGVIKLVEADPDPARCR